MDRTKRRSRRLAEKRRRTRKSGKRRMSVGDAFGVRACEEVDVTNLAEAHAMSSAIAAAANLAEPEQTPASARAYAKATKSRRKREQRSKRKGRSRARSHSPYKAKVPACDRSAASSTRATRQRRASSARASLEARVLTRDLFDSGDEPPALDNSGGERKTESEGEQNERAHKEMEDEHAQWERTHRSYLSAIETPLSQRTQPDSGDEGFVVSEGNDTIFDSQDSDYRAETTEESEFRTASEVSDADDQRRLAIVVRNSLEEVAEDDEPKPSEDASEPRKNANASAHEASACGASPVKAKRKPRSEKRTPSKGASSATWRKPNGASTKPHHRSQTKTRNRNSGSQRGERDSRKQRTRKRRELKEKPPRSRYTPLRQEFNERRFKRMGHRRARCGKDEEGAPPYRMPEREREYLEKLKKAEKYKHKGRRWRRYLKRKRRKKQYHSSDPSTSSSSSSSSSGKTGTTTTSSSTSIRSTESTSTEATDEDSSRSYETSTGDSDDELVGDIYNRHLRERRFQMHAPPTVVYSSQDLKRVRAPTLNNGSKQARKAFRVKYLRYAQEHANVMRGRPPSHRVPPKAVVECIEADLLQYVCRHELPRKYRTKRPSTVNALVVHNWVMKVKGSLLDAEDSEGISQLRKLKCTIGGANGVNEVQQFFIKIRKLRKLHRIKISEKQIISWLSYNILPIEVKRTVAGILRQNTKRGRLASRYLSKFHKLLMTIAKTFSRSFELGLGLKAKKNGKGKEGGNASNDDAGDNRRSSEKSGRGGKKRQNRGNRGKNGRNDANNSNNPNPTNTGGGRTARKGKQPPADLKCINCGGNHYVSKCPTVPKDRKNWSFAQWLDAKNSDNSSSAAPKRRKTAKVQDDNEDSTPRETEDGSSEETGNGQSHPRGGRSRKKKGSKKRQLTTNVKALERTVLGDGADGAVEIAGVPGSYVCDGGCDRATITKAYADKIAQKGLKVHHHKNPKCATLADGSKKPIIIGYLYANVTLKTGAGIVTLSNVYIDVIDGKDEGNLMLVGKVEEAALGLKSMAQQLRELAKVHEGKRKVRFAPSNDNQDLYAELTADEVKAAYITGTSIRAKGSSDGELNMMGLEWDEVNSQTDGHCFIGEANWQAGIATKIHCDSLRLENWITTGALRGTELESKIEKLEKPHDGGGPGMLHLWLGKNDPVIVGELRATIRVVPHGKKVGKYEDYELVRRLTTLPDLEFQVIESDEPAVVMGLFDKRRLERRKVEDLEMDPDREDQADEIDLRLQEQLDAAKLAGMSPAGIKRAEHLIREKYKDVWRINLGPKDFVDLAPLTIELKDENFWLPKPYMRNYSADEMKWWKTTMKQMVKDGIFRKSSSNYLSPSNLVKKQEEGIIKLGKYRMVVDMRNLNKQIKDLDFTLPNLALIVQLLLGTVCFAKGDGCKGYRQFLVAQISRRLTGFSSPLGSFEHMRVPMGLKIAAAYYQRCMHTILGDLLYDCVLQYLDDTLVYARSESGLLDSLDKMFERFMQFNLKLHPGKFVLYATELTWGGKTVDGEGVRPSERRLTAIRDMPEPETLAEMMSFIYGVAWFRGHLMRFAETAAPLYDLWNKTMEPYEKKTTNRAKRFRLAELPGWVSGGKEAYQAVKELMANAVANAYFDPNLRLCVFADASKDFYCMMFTQCEYGDEKLPWDEQVGKHRLLTIVSGRFRHAQLR